MLKSLRDRSPVNHDSVIDLDSIQPSSSAASAIVSTPTSDEKQITPRTILSPEHVDYFSMIENISTPTSNEKQITPRTILSPEHMDYFSMIENLKDPRKLNNKNITSEILYNMICGQESRLYALENKVKTLTAENTYLKEKLVVTDNQVSDSALGLVTQNLAVASDGIASLEEFQATCTARLDALELDPNQVMETGEREHSSETESLQRLQNDLQSHISSMSNFARDVKRENRRRHLEYDQQEQYSRRDCIIVRGVPYKTGEDTTSIMCRIAYSIGVNLVPSDISTSHRTGRQTGRSPRPIICKFTRHDTKYTMMSNRAEMRHIKTDDDGNPVRIYIDENLTQMRARVCKQLRDNKTLHYVRDGKIHLTLEQGTEKILDSPSDWESLDWSDSQKMELGIYPRD